MTKYRNELQDICENPQKMRNLHWDEQEYKDLLPIYEEIGRKMDNMGSE